MEEAGRTHLSAALLVGGRGSRLEPLSPQVPKPLMAFEGVPLLRIMSDQLLAAGVRELHFALGHAGDVIRVWAEQSLRSAGVELSFHQEVQPLGTAGALAFVERPGHCLLVCNGDTLTDLDFGWLASQHAAAAAEITIAAVALETAVPFGVLTAGPGGELISWKEKPLDRRLISSGLYALSPAALSLIERGERLDMPDLVSRAAEAGLRIRVAVYDGAWFDIGTPEKYAAAAAAFAADPSRFTRHVRPSTSGRGGVSHAASEPRVSIVIPTFNTASMTLECCRRAIAAAGVAEIIVVDDGSDDDTCSRLASALPQVTIIRSETNGGFAAAVNRGVAASRGTILLLLNSDVLLDAGSVDALVAAFDQQSRLGVAGATLRNPDGSPQWSGGRFPSLAWLFVLTSGLAWANPRRAARRPGVDWVSGAAMAIRRETWDAVGPMETDYRFYSQDLAFCSRAASAGWIVALVEGAGAVHELGATTRQRAGADLSPHPAWQWPDLLTWARRYRGGAWPAAARVVMIAGGVLRLAARALRAVAVMPEDRQRHRRATSAYREAVRALLSWHGSNTSPPA